MIAEGFFKTTSCGIVPTLVKPPDSVSDNRQCADLQGACYDDTTYFTKSWATQCPKSK